VRMQRGKGSLSFLLLLRLGIGEEEIGVGLLGYVLLGCGCSPPDGYGALDPLKGRALTATTLFRSPCMSVTCIEKKEVLLCWSILSAIVSIKLPPFGSFPVKRLTWPSTFRVIGQG
jgi:hypothetical protein